MRRCALLAIALMAGATSADADEIQYKMSSDSMLPLLRKGDVVACDKSDRGSITIGDLVVYRHPKRKDDAWLKMVVGVGGDALEMRRGRLYINGMAVPKIAAGEFEISDPEGKTEKVPQFEETLPNGVKTLVLDSYPDGPSDFVSPRNVPAGHVFVIGNNRDGSVDSRSLTEHGFVPEEDIVCKARLPGERA